MKLSYMIGFAICVALGIAFLLSPFGPGPFAFAPKFAADDTAPARSPDPSAVPVVVELFTSEGCSSCPPADRLLAHLDRTQPVPGARIIALEQHVDYWNNDGWMDPFSSAFFTERQSDYVRALHADTSYTPQMVVDGAAEFVGSDERTALAAIAKSSQTPKANIELEPRQDSKSGAGKVALRVRLEPVAGWIARDSADVVLAITEDGLSSNVTRGENKGSQLAHRAVVRRLRVIGALKSDGSFSADPDENLEKNWKRDNLHAVVFIQQRGSRRILGAAEISLAAPAAPATTAGGS
jgi:hypothetical protein